MITREGTHWYHRQHQTYHSYSASNDFVWVGLAYMCPSETASGRWSDGTRLNSSIQIEDAPKPTPSYSPYSSGYSGYSGLGSSSSYGSSSTTSRGQQRCVSYNLTPKGGKLIKTYCLDYAPFLCKSLKNANKTDPVDVWKEDADDTDSQCSGYDWCHNNGSCYKILTKEQSWHESRSSCQADGGDLVAIHSVTEIDYLNNNLSADWNAGNSFWTGMNKLESIDDRFQWSDYSPIDFLPNVTVEVRNREGAARNPSCVSLKVSQFRRLLAKSSAAGKMRVNSDGEFQLSRCDTTRSAICKRPAKNAAIVPSPATTAAPANGGCAKGWILFRNRCYRSFGVENDTSSDRANYRDAQQTCAKFKSNLVSIQNNFDNLFVLSMLNNEDLNQSWIGLLHNEGKLKWIDESEVGYTNFDAIGMATFGYGRTTPSPVGSTTSSLYSSRTSWSDYLGYGSYSSSYLWRQQERCFVMSLDKSPGTWDAISSSGSLTSLISRTPTSSPSYRDGVLRGKRDSRVYWPYDWRRSFTLAGESCEQMKLPFVCEKSKAANETSGEQEWLCENETNDDNKSFFKHGSNCYEIVTDTPSTWDEAKKNCEKSSATLTSILTQQEYAYLVSLMKKRNDLASFWIGLQIVGEDNTTAAHVQWVDEWPVWITKWENSPAADKDRACVAMKEIGDAPRWFQESCQTKLPYVCKHRRSQESAPKPAKPGRCEAGWISGSTQCYKIKKDDWTSGANAMLRCWREDNATLASFPTEADWALISKNQELKESKRRFFIGLMQKAHGTFEWIDGSPLDFVNWAPQEPRFGWNPSVEVCVEMDQNGLWYDAGCHETRHFICSKPKTEDGSKSSSDASTATSKTPTVPSSSKLTSSSPSTAASSAGKTPSNRPSTVSSTVAESSTSSNASDAANVLSNLPSSQKSKTAVSQTGVIAGIVICVLFLLVVAVLGIVYVYRQHSQGLPLFRRRSTDAMRFEILNERNDEY